MLPDIGMKSVTSPMPSSDRKRVSSTVRCGDVAVVVADSREPRAFAEDDLKFLQGYATLLAFAGAKMLISDVVHLDIWLSLGIIVLFFVVALKIEWEAIAAIAGADTAPPVIAKASASATGVTKRMIIFSSAPGGQALLVYAPIRGRRVNDV
jgi:hypothetical protein